MAEYNWIDHTYDVVVVGAGGSGLRADPRRRGSGPSRTACVSKVFPTRVLTRSPRKAELRLRSSNMGA